jgi:hypothetical protein
LTLATTILAQPAGPRLAYVYPAGGQAGTTFTVKVGGQGLAGATNVLISGTGAQAAVTAYNRPMPPGEFNNLRDELRALQDKRAAALKAGRRRGGQGGASSTNTWTDADEKRLAEIRDRILKDPPNRQISPALAEVVTLQVTLAPEAPAGDRELRIGTANGLSNPLRFCVGQLAEFSKPPAQSPNPDLDRFLARLGRPPMRPANQVEFRVTLPTVVNGQILPGAADRFRFHARQGQPLVISVRARDLIPYLADAVPGWFQATLALFDAAGKEVAYADDFRFHPDPVLHVEVPHDGEYVLEIKDAIYRGREDFVYRLSMGERPFITAHFPLGGPAGKETLVELQGWNLPTNRVTIPASHAAPGLQWVSVGQGERLSNRVPFAVDSLPEALEQEPNNTPPNAQPVALPVIVNGRIERPGDCDVFRFAGRAGDALVAEVTARRLDSPLDSVLRLTDARGAPLAFNDDHEDKASGLNTHHADSYLRVTLPADGAYYVHLGDAQRQGGAEFAYRLRLGPPQPDFALRVVPASVFARGGATVPLTVFALRIDGFSNAITLALKDAPEGFTLSGARVPAGQDQVRLTLTAPLVPLAEPCSLNLEGRAVIQGRAMVRPAVPAEDMMQAFAYRHLVPAQELQVAVSGRGPGRGAMRIFSPLPVKIPAGGTARLVVGLPPNPRQGRLQLELSEPPEGLSLKSVAPAGLGTEIVLQSDAAKMKPGLAGNLIVSAFAAPANPNAKAPNTKARANPRRIQVATLPAIPFEIVRSR